MEAHFHNQFDELICLNTFLPTKKLLNDLPQETKYLASMFQESPVYNTDYETGFPLE